MIRIYLSILFALSAILYAPSAANAGQYGCDNQYGGNCPSEEFYIKKYVKDPKTNNFADSLGSYDNRFSPGSEAEFKIYIHNTGSEKLKNIIIKDKLPNYITFVSGTGSFDNNTKTLTIEIDRLNSGESREFIIKTKIAGTEKFPSNEGIICLINQSQAEYNGKISSDNAQLCVEKPVLGVTTKGGLKVFPAPQAKSTPPTGPEAIALIGLIPAGISGFMLRKNQSK